MVPVEAMLAIKEAYKLKKNWMGDPCFPKQYAWDGLSCSNGGNDSRILAVNLSHSGLVGTISNSFTMLKAINFLDLSYNNLTGSVPDFLADIQSLHVLNLTGNHFTGVMPDALLKKSLSGSLILRPLLLSFLIVAVHVHGQSPRIDGFTSIDCGATSNSIDDSTGIEYTTDDQLIDTGTNYNIASNYINSSLPKQYLTVRSFPQGGRNCYTLHAIKNYKYLLRAGFMYGNYDGNNSLQANSDPLLFDLYIGVFLWKTVNIASTSDAYVYEAITVALGDFVSVCLMRRSNSSSTPFISFLEMRQLKSVLYPAATPSDYIVFSERLNLGATTPDIIRYPDDPYDRIWKPKNITADVLITASNITHFKDDEFEVPTIVHQTAAVSANVNDSIVFSWNSEISNDGPYYYVSLHFSEFTPVSATDVREFNVYSNDELWFERYRPPYLMSGYIYSNSPLGNYPRHVFSLNATTNSTRPPLIGAYEIYYLVSIGDVKRTHVGDVEAMLAIKAEYKMKKNWMGDPCSPEEYIWDGVNCSDGGNDSRITELNLSSNGLVGQISTLFSRLTAIKFLDLSYNNLSGKFPDPLADISSLVVLNLTGNCITEIPDRLVKKSTDGLLKLSFDTCNSSNTTTPSDQKRNTLLIIILSVIPPILLIVVVVLIVRRIRRKTQAADHEVGQLPSEIRQFNVDHGGNQLSYTSHLSDVDHKDSQLQFESRQFMYIELENITKNFSHILGKGGFGIVYHGSLEDGIEVAVKMCSLSSEQAPNLFLAEVENLSRVRHKNLVSLVGYCMDRGCLAVVYEYMPLGSLEDHLRGKAGISRALSWAERLQIVLDAAQGLDYLYNGCPMPIVHRDVKSSNILLGQNLEAKVSDFGLSKAFHSDLQTHVSMTALAFSPGYVDPVCLQSWKFNEKTDVYSFGVVLLEIITGEPPIRRVGDVHIIERAQLSFGVGDIDAIVDARLQRVYDTDSVWKVAELAMNCTTRAINRRPKMAEVVTQLRESLECETAGRRKNITGESTASSPNITFPKESAIFSPSAR
ncbi:senescence-induced receptor-like serine/threonine-protein kinase [Typha latifolia]|uniref:senescence-induced receptor-like serine/threonine-protein kinase n=1 Tax=Typha latifolia TaxID=4733 RepID=UPI003C2DF3B0